MKIGKLKIDKMAIYENELQKNGREEILEYKMWYLEYKVSHYLKISTRNDNEILFSLIYSSDVVSRKFLDAAKNEPVTITT